MNFVRGLTKPLNILMYTTVDRCIDEFLFRGVRKMAQTTTIRVSRETKDQLEGEKDYKNETYDEVVRELLLERERRLKNKIEKAKEQEGIPLEEVKEQLGLV